MTKPGKAYRIDVFRWLVHLASLAPLVWMAYDWWAGNLSVNPVQDLTHRTGKTALTLLLLSLACTPANTVFGFSQALKVRRALGLYAFMYACIHLFIYVGLDYQFAWGLLLRETVEKRYIWVGLSALLLLIPLAATSFQYWMKRLGKDWKRLHRLVYLAAPLVVLHFAWVVKGSITTLQGDIVQPVLYGLALTLLLVLRLAPVRRWASGLRQAAALAGRKPAVHKQTTDC